MVTQSHDQVSMVTLHHRSATSSELLSLLVQTDGTSTLTSTCTVGEKNSSLQIIKLLIKPQN